MTGTTGFVRSAEAEIAIRVDGPAHLPWLVLSNSLAADMSMWDDQMPALTRSHRVLRYDSRGHGRSTAPAGPYSFDHLVGDLLAAMDAVGAARADLLGLSMGGMTALGVGLAYPERVGRLICAAARADAPLPFVAGWDQRIAAVESGGMSALLGGTLERWFTPALREARPETVDRAARMILATAPTGYIGCAQALKRLDYLRHLPAMRPSVLFIAGEVDMAAPVAAMQEMAQATPEGTLTVLPDVAHLCNMEDPDGFTAAVAEFLGRTRQAAE
ncbi:alpha/beta fold hydrolase [Ancylobacter sp. IITR112]|uniref:alpha/beta fold hydrolase n=1 Tax=Ancylobacter sp. IITR112 TaxID=3138073 RepID=UPI00352AA8A1